MPRDRRSLEEVARLTADHSAPTADELDDAIDRRRRGEEGADDESDDEPLPLSAEILRRWPQMTAAQRRQCLRVAIAEKFRKRFGFSWPLPELSPDDPRLFWNYLVVTPPASVDNTTGRGGPPRHRGRRQSERSRFVATWDRCNIMNLPDRTGPEPHGNDENKTLITTRARFLSVQELTWISILGGNVPPAAAWRDPDEVMRAERTLIKEALDRHGQRASGAWDGEKYVRTKIPRGPRARTK